MVVPHDYQFVVGDGTVSVPDGFTVREAGTHSIAADSRFVGLEVKNTRGAAVATIVGFPYFAPAGRFLEHGTGADALPGCDSFEDIEQLQAQLAGSYVLVTYGTLSDRLYLDHGGSIPTVFDTRTGRCASSVELLLSDAEYDDRFNESLHRRAVLAEGKGGWITGTLTAHVDLHRLLPNHYLDLDTLEVKRHWPTDFGADDFIAIEDAATTVVRDMSAFSRAAFAAHRVSQTLTAGYDSRLLLACCRDFAQECGFFTMMTTTGDLDVAVASHLATMHGLKHEAIPLVYSTTAEIETWDRAVGDSIREVNREIYPTLRQVRDAAFTITGMYGEVGRCRLYRQDYARINEMEVDADFVISRLTIPLIDEFRENIGAWIDSLPSIPNSAVLDLAFHELKFGSWAMGQNPIQNVVLYNLYPFAQRPVLDAFLRTDPREKTTHALFDACIARAWPELAKVPVNKYGDHRDILSKFRKLMMPHRLRRFLRDRLARSR